MPGLFQIHGFIHEKVWRKHNTIPYYINLSTLEYTGGDAPEYIFLTFKLKSVSSIRPSLETCYDIIFRSKNIHYFAFALVAPLQT